MKIDKDETELLKEFTERPEVQNQIINSIYLNRIVA